MSLRDRFRSRHTDAGTDADTSPAAPQPVVPAARLSGNITDFGPRPDGEYVCDQHGIYLRFIRPLVTESIAGRRTNATGEFTAAGRFAVQLPFERAVIYTVLTADDEALTVRRTDTADGSTAELEFVFRPDPDGEA